MSGICRICGCTETTPCEINMSEFSDRIAMVPCSWMDEGQTLCSNPRCVAVVPIDELIRICIPVGLLAELQP